MSGLHRLYRISGYLSAACLVLICAVVLAQIIARNLGSTVRDADEFAAWAMAAAGFFGLVYTLHCGAHIRVSVVTRFVPEKLHHSLEVLASATGLALATFLAWCCARFVLESYQFNDLSQGLIPVPMWIPQLPMAIGSFLLALGFSERLWCVLNGRPFETGDAQENSE